MGSISQLIAYGCREIGVVLPFIYFQRDMINKICNPIYSAFNKKYEHEILQEKKYHNPVTGIPLNWCFDIKKYRELIGKYHKQIKLIRLSKKIKEISRLKIREIINDTTFRKHFDEICILSKRIKKIRKNAYSNKVKLREIYDEIKKFLVADRENMNIVREEIKKKCQRLIKSANIKDKYIEYRDQYLLEQKIDRRKNFNKFIRRIQSNNDDKNKDLYLINNTKKYVDFLYGNIAGFDDTFIHRD
jgi:hypothetical protein